MTPPAIHGKMPFPLNSGQANAVKAKQGLGGDPAVDLDDVSGTAGDVKAKQGLGGDPAGLPKSPRKYKGCIRDR
jgi:hypothetical protein